MAFEYNGIIHRDLEPQVRYDAEQIQLLKQADVAINENLQTVNESLQAVNTEVSNKLTKPTNPSAESAVTMLADGTVGTKLLSEIGGGGKLYRHEISVTVEENSYLYFYFTDNVQNYSTFKDIPIKKGVGYYTSNTNTDCSAAFKIDVSGNMLCIYIATMNITNPSEGVQYTDIYKDFSLIHYTDTAIQL